MGTFNSELREKYAQGFWAKMSSIYRGKTDEECIESWKSRHAENGLYNGLTSFHGIAWERAGGSQKERRKRSYVPRCLDTAEEIPSEVEAKSKGLKKSKGRKKNPFEVDEIGSPSKGPFRVVSFFLL